MYYNFKPGVIHNTNFVATNNQLLPVESQQRLQPMAPPIYIPPIQNKNFDQNKIAPPPSYKELFG